MFQPCKSFIILLFLSCCLITAAQAGWNAKCLDDCFSTGHDCKYCNWQCYSEDTYTPGAHYENDSVCAIPNYTAPVNN